VNVDRTAVDRLGRVQIQVQLPFEGVSAMLIFQSLTLPSQVLSASDSPASARGTNRPTSASSGPLCSVTR